MLGGDLEDSVQRALGLALAVAILALIVLAGLPQLLRALGHRVAAALAPSPRLRPAASEGVAQAQEHLVQGHVVDVDVADVYPREIG